MSVADAPDDGPPNVRCVGTAAWATAACDALDEYGLRATVGNAVPGDCAADVDCYLVGPLPEDTDSEALESSLRAEASPTLVATDDSPLAAAAASVVPESASGAELALAVERAVCARRAARLREERRRFETMLNHAPTVAWMTDDEFEDLTFVNDTYEDLWGLSKRAAYEDSMDYLQRVHPADRDRIRDRVMDIYADATDPDASVRDTYELEFRIVTDDGIRWVDEWVFPIVEDGEVTHWGGLSEDVTAAREREAELRRTTEWMRELARLVTHDIRNPLAVADGNLALLDEEGGCDDDTVRTIARSLDRIETLVDEMRTLVRGAESPTFETVSLRSVADAAWNSVETGDAVLRTDWDARHVVEGDETLLRSLFENLFRNAVEHGDASTVRVEGFDGGFAVADDGSGIPPADRESAFELGFSTRPGGTGYGLAIVGRIAAQHGWTVSLEDGEEGGARFVFEGLATDESERTEAGHT